MNSKISDKDKKDWENFLLKNESLPNKDSNHKIYKIKKKIIFDLHGYTLNDANKKIYDLINDSFNQKVKKLVIITGKGIHSQNKNNPYISEELGTLRFSVPEFIKSNLKLMSMIEKIEEANIEDGGNGAFYIFLKKKL